MVDTRGKGNKYPTIYSYTQKNFKYDRQQGVKVINILLLHTKEFQVWLTAWGKGNKYPTIYSYTQRNFKYG